MQFFHSALVESGSVNNCNSLLDWCKMHHLSSPIYYGENPVVPSLEVATRIR